MSSPNPSIVIVGGGFSGTLTAVQLLRQQTHPCTIHLIEKTEKSGRGTAYGTASWAHLLNVPAAKMGAWESPDHFFRWINQHPEALPPGSPHLLPTDFAPRRTFGTYLQAQLQEAEASKAAAVSFHRHHDEAIDVLSENGTASVVLASGITLAADRVVLALGNFPPRPLIPSDHPFSKSARYLNDPWAAGLLDLGPLANDRSPVLLVGTGLTMVDVALSLRERGHHGPMLALSRRGFLPQVHRLGKPFAASFPAVFPKTVAGMLRWIRAEVKRAATLDFPWQAVIDALRPHTQAVWRAFPRNEQQRFLRHARIYWDIHRHRIAPEIADRLASMRAGKNLSVIAGRLERFEETGHGVSVTYRPRGSQASKTVDVGLVINCTGPDARFAADASRLVASLRRRGMIVPSPLGMGLDGLPDGQLYQADRTLSPFLFAIGPARQPLLWETTAVPELRDQTCAMATLVLESLRTDLQATAAPRAVEKQPTVPLR